MTLILNHICYKQPNRSYKNLTNKEELRNALNIAAANGEDYTINIAAGIYDTGGTTFTYTPPPAVEENLTLTIAGAGTGITLLDGAENAEIFHPATPE